MRFISDRSAKRGSTAVAVDIQTYTFAMQYAASSCARSTTGLAGHHRSGVDAV